MALRLASGSFRERKRVRFHRRCENSPSPVTERRLLLTAKRFHTVWLIYAQNQHQPFRGQSLSAV